VLAKKIAVGGKIMKNPKVFISYAWTSESYTEKVINLARRLMSDGIDVLLDKFEMTPGKELHNFMEKCVKDPTVTNVLILLNPTYAEKADGRKGGVGNETQIISNEVYADVEQTKFIPVIFETDDGDYDSCRPLFLKGRVYVDLSKSDEFEINYMNLVKILYGVEVYVKPQLGQKPLWVDNDPKVTEITQKIKSYNGSSSFPGIINKLVDESLENLVGLIISDEIFKNLDSSNCEHFYESYRHMMRYRNDFLEILKATYDSKEPIKKYLKFFQNVKRNAADYRKNNAYMQADYLNTFLHEIFIYTIAYYLKKEMYQQINDLIYTSYVTYEYGQMYHDPVDFKSFFFSYNNKVDELLTKYVSKRDMKNYLTGKGHVWVNSIYEPMFSKNDFINADILLTNLSIIKNPQGSCWFATTYIYQDYNSNIIKRIAIEIKSRKLAMAYYPLFNVKSIDEIKQKFESIKEYQISRIYKLGYDGSIYKIGLLPDFIELDDIGEFE
jgi:hypothetical protein